jgi:hypothetical protein
VDRWHKWTAGLVVCILLFFGLGYLIVKPKAANYPPYLSSSPALDGTKAVSLLLEEKGRQVREWRRPVRFLPGKENQALLLIQPHSVEEGEKKHILEWVSRGNDLLLFDENPGNWEIFKIEKKQEYQPGLKTLISKKGLQNEPLTGMVNTSNRLSGINDADVLLSDDLGVIAAQTSSGRGTVTIFLTPQWLTNNEILNLSHFTIVWPSLQKEWDTIWFDEYHHGLRSQPPLLAVYPGWLIMALVQLTAALLLWIWWKGKRFGPVYTPREWVVRRGDETLLAAASWYEGQKLSRAAMRHQISYLRHLVVERWCLQANASDQDLVRKARALWGDEQAEDLDQLFLRLAKDNRLYTDKQLLLDSGKLDKIRHLLEE